MAGIVESPTLAANALRVVAAAAVLAAGVALATPALPAGASEPAGAATSTLDNGPAGLGSPELDIVSCPDASWCMAVESSPYTTDSLERNDGTWMQVRLDSSPSGLELEAISCASETLCTAVGTQATTPTAPSGPAGDFRRTRRDREVGRDELVRGAEPGVGRLGHHRRRLSPGA
ncbi:MAG TPA: hypothetical protein VMD59_19215 [Acidimicrobiales bacterium]|nr:hypothetical protein [Acidimicrobiales bacterium]